MLEGIQKKADEIEQKIINYRRDFHKYAEYGWTEYRTSSLIAKRLEELGYDVKVGKEILSGKDRMGLPSKGVLEKCWQRAVEQGGDIKYLNKMKNGYTGVVGIIKNGKGPVRALRFDIDALEIEESIDLNHFPAKEGFASVNKEAAHACGHDCHASTGLGIAEILADQKENIKGTIKLIFQPAEEGVRGAKSIVESGVLDDVNIIIGHHVHGDWNLAEISSGISDYIATKKFDVTIYGKAAHAGENPNGGNNALVAASNAILNLYAIPRHKDGETRINVGKLYAGSGRNIICDKVQMIMETRGANTEISEYMYNKAVKIIKGSSMMQDCSVEITQMGESQSAKSDKELMDIVEKTALEIGGYTLLDIHKSGGSEDFTYMMSKIQKNGGYAISIGIGAGKKNAGAAHSHNFDVDERVIKKAVILLTTLVLKRAIFANFL